MTIKDKEKKELSQNTKETTRNSNTQASRSRALPRVGRFIIQLERFFEGLGQAGVEGLGDGLTVEVLADEDDFLHAVAVGVVPVAL